MAASGIRSIRFAREVPGIKQIIANDRSTQAFESLQRNIEFNEVGNLVKPVCSDARYIIQKFLQIEICSESVVQGGYY